MNSQHQTLDVLVYCGKGMYYAEENEFEYVSPTERIPVELSRPFLNRGHVQFTDNFYNTGFPRLFFTTWKRAWIGKVCKQAAAAKLTEAFSMMFC